MGGSYWRYFVPYEEDKRLALAQLQARIFKSGEYRHHNSTQAITPSSVEQLRELVGEDGTHSILDVVAIADFPAEILDPQIELDLVSRIKSRDDLYEFQWRTGRLPFLVLYPLTDSQCLKLYGNAHPTRAEVEGSLRSLDLDQALWAELKLSTCYYTTIYKNDRADEIMLIGFTGD